MNFKNKIDRIISGFIQSKIDMRLGSSIQPSRRPECYSFFVERMRDVPLPFVSGDMSIITRFTSSSGDGRVLMRGLIEVENDSLVEEAIQQEMNDLNKRTFLCTLPIWGNLTDLCSEDFKIHFSSDFIECFADCNITQELKTELVNSLTSLPRVQCSIISDSNGDIAINYNNGLTYSDLEGNGFYTFSEGQTDGTTDLSELRIEDCKLEMIYCSDFVIRMLDSEPFIRMLPEDCPIRFLGDTIEFEATETYEYNHPEFEDPRYRERLYIVGDYEVTHRLSLPEESSDEYYKVSITRIYPSTRRFTYDAMRRGEGDSVVVSNEPSMIRIEDVGSLFYDDKAYTDRLAHSAILTLYEMFEGRE